MRIVRALAAVALTVPLMAAAVAAPAVHAASPQSPYAALAAFGKKYTGDPVKVTTRNLVTGSYTVTLTPTRRVSTFTPAPGNGADGYKETCVIVKTKLGACTKKMIPTPGSGGDFVVVPGSQATTVPQITTDFATVLASLAPSRTYNPTDWTVTTSGKVTDYTTSSPAYGNRPLTLRVAPNRVSIGFPTDDGYQPIYILTATK